MLTHSLFPLKDGDDEGKVIVLCAQSTRQINKIMLGHGQVSLFVHL